MVDENIRDVWANIIDDPVDSRCSTNYSLDSLIFGDIDEWFSIKSSPQIVTFGYFWMITLLINQGISYRCNPELTVSLHQSLGDGGTNFTAMGLRGLATYTSSAFFSRIRLESSSSKPKWMMERWWKQMETFMETINFLETFMETFEVQMDFNPVALELKTKKYWYTATKGLGLTLLRQSTRNPEWEHHFIYRSLTQNQHLQPSKTLISFIKINIHVIHQKNMCYIYIHKLYKYIHTYVLCI